MRNVFRSAHFIRRKKEKKKSLPSACDLYECLFIMHSTLTDHKAYNVFLKATSSSCFLLKDDDSAAEMKIFQRDWCNHLSSLTLCLCCPSDCQGEGDILVNLLSSISYTGMWWLCVNTPEPCMCCASAESFKKVKLVIIDHMQWMD